MTARSEIRLHPFGLNFISAPQTVAIAVSGGGDSLCLLQLCHEWANAAGHNLHVLTVDHRLRRGSAGEANWVKEQSTGLGLQHHTLVWKHPRPSQAAARQARHRLLAQACQKIGARWLLLGHTLDDVTETIAMRAARDIAAEKQAGPMLVSVSPVWPEGEDLLLLRPLILQRRDVIRAYLQVNGVEWIDDPSNHNLAFERIRQRQALVANAEATGQAALSALQLRIENMLPLTADLRSIAEQVDAFGLITLPLRFADEHMDALLTYLIPAAAGHDRPPRATDRKSLISELGTTQNGQRFTLGGAWLERKSDHILIGRDPGPDPADYNGQLWDGRFEAIEHAFLSEETPPFLVRHAVPPNRNWRCIVADRLNTEATAIELNQALLTKLHESAQS